MDTFLIKAAQLLLSLCILVALHEGGHFFFSKLFKVRVEKFYLFFNPYFHLFSTKDKWFTRLFPNFNKRTETEYGLGWLPLGGYVKIAGMIDESMDTEQLKQPVQPWEFRAKPAWQRLLIMIGGVLVNFLLALVIYAAVLFTWGRDVMPMDNLKEGLAFNETGRSMGFQNGDLIVGADEQTFTEWNYGKVLRAVTEAETVTVLRHGEEVQITLPEKLDMLQLLKEQPPFFAPIVPSVTDSVLPGTPAYEAGMRTGCQIVGLDGQAISSWNEFDALMSRRADVLAAGCSAADSARLREMVVAYRASVTAPIIDTVALTLTPSYQMGIVKQSFYKAFGTEHVEYGLFESIPAGVAYGIEVLTGYVSDLKYLFSAEGAKSVGSFGAIGSLFPPVWDWQAFWMMTAFLSLMLAFMNILPIPALDGGHVLFLVVEMILRRPLSDKVMERAQTVGMVLLMGLMALAVFNDLVRFVF